MYIYQISECFGFEETECFGLFGDYVIVNLQNITLENILYTIIYYKIYNRYIEIFTIAKEITEMIELNAYDVRI